ncbi:hypothetical protein [Gelidibacter sp.]|uniref:hypothetical protein n=1 Tax=Gelidibacter sp. TaxID=2018083 RepID=UPI0032648F4D
MANTLDPMDLKQIISLHIDGFSNRKIGATLGMSRNKVNSFMRMFKASTRSLEELLASGNVALETLFPSSATITNPVMRSSCCILMVSIKRGTILGLPFCSTISNMYRPLRNPTVIPSSWSITTVSLQRPRDP